MLRPLFRCTALAPLRRSLPLAFTLLAITVHAQSKPAAPQGTTPKPVAPQSSPNAETHMSKDEIAGLFRSVDDILAFASKDSHLANNRPIQRKVLSRDEVNSIMRKKLDEDESSKRLQRDELVLKKFGLLDRDFNLKPFLVTLLTEQVAGFYDPKTRTVNLLDWIKPEDQKPVLAHELTHALQDNRVSLEKWGSPLPDEISRDEHADNRHLQLDEASTARESVSEGQAMVVFVDYGLKDTGKTLATVPELGDRVRDSAGDTSGSPILARAPLLLQESLLFPYSAGLAFEQALLQHGGVDAAFGGALDRPPTSSHEVMHPEDYIAHTPVPILAMPDIHPLLAKDWTPYDIGVMGELDVRITAELFGGQQIAGPLATAWDGGLYYAAQRKSASAAEKLTTGSLGLLYFSRWKNADSARSFLKVYSSQLPRKYDGLKRTDPKDADDDHQHYTTGEGDVLLTLVGNSVYISEGFDTALATQMETKLREAQGSGPLQNASLVPSQSRNELTLRFSHALGAYGVAKAAIPSNLVTP